MKLLGTVAVLLGLTFGGWFAYNKFLKEVPVSGFVTKPVMRGDIVKTVSATGTIEPLVKVIVGSELSGRIKKWYADFNAPVGTGTVLAEIDPDRFQTTHDRSAAELELAKAREEELLVRYKDAERERKRIEGLRAQNNASENELLIARANEEAAKAAWHGSIASIKSAEAILNSARVDLERTVIRSPIDGVVIARNIEDGQTVAASFQAPELFVIANDLTKMQVNANVSEADIGLIHEGGPASFRVDAYPNRQFHGTISQIRFNATALDGVVTYVTLIEATNEDLALRPGMTANITFEVARADGVLQIPNAALRFDPNPPDPAGMAMKPLSGPPKPTVYINRDGKPTPREVKVGLTNGMLTQLIGDELKEGDEVIIERNYSGGGTGGARRMGVPTRRM
ncbi:MAG: efflux RND transporter periplasmic adaptor subunit [Phycisphaerae bacterium]|nr:efflux RND transporter periplasmic adaptor subunit [Phycisphaerae bacterium]